jgi:lipopolysaccharide transport system permease protein
MVDDKTTVIRARPNLSWPDFGELWKFRELLLVLTFRDIKIRYKQTAIGILWAGLQPFLTMVVFTLIFGKVAKMPSEGLPYAVFTMTALMPWQFFARALMQGSFSLVHMQAMMTKVYFPRLIAPLAEIMAGLVDFAIAFIILLGIMAWYGIVPGPQIVALPAFVLLAIVISLAVALWLSAINIEYRDIQYALPFVTQLWMFATPVVYPVSVVPDQWRWLLMLNPMTIVVEGFRWSLLGKGWVLTPINITISFLCISIVLIFGLRYFDRVQRTFADRV